MKPPKPVLPTWARQERASDLAWIMDNHHIFWPHAHEQYRQTGRGAIVVNAESHAPGLGNPFTYLTEAEVIENCDDDVQRMVRQYRPETEMVIVLLKSRERVSSYRVLNVGDG